MNLTLVLLADGQLVVLRHNRAMPNRAIEFHDSTFDGLEREEANVTLRFSAAYIHEFNGKPLP